MRPIWLLLLIPVTSAAAASQCEQKAVTQADLNGCAMASLKVADQSLEKFYISYKKRLRPKQANLFDAETSEWLKYRKTYCEFESSGVLGGSAHPMIFIDCMTSQSEKRLRELKKLAHCHEGDLSCPAWQQ